MTTIGPRRDDLMLSPSGGPASIILSILSSSLLVLLLLLLFLSISLFIFVLIWISWFEILHTRKRDVERRLHRIFSNLEESVTFRPALETMYFVGRFSFRDQSIVSGSVLDWSAVPILRKWSGLCRVEKSGKMHTEIGENIKVTQIYTCLKHTCSVRYFIENISKTYRKACSINFCLAYSIPNRSITSRLSTYLVFNIWHQI